MKTQARELPTHKFLQNVDHPNPDHLTLVRPGMECQVNVSPGDGAPVKGRRATWAKGRDRWFNYRIYDEASANKRTVFSLEDHAHAIGSSGFSFRDKMSYWAGFDFDTITGHAKGVGISDTDLKLVEEKSIALPFLDVRNSTGGAGIHLFAHVEGFHTQNREEHAALARAILGLMGRETGFDFASKIDAWGMIMWFWRRGLNPESFKLIKAHTETLTEADLPNWRDHVDVVTRKRHKVKLPGDGDRWDQLASTRHRVPLDAEHKKHIDALAKSGCSAVWVDDHHLLQTHTVGFRDVFKAGGIKGCYLTNSPGSDLATPNCFAFPLSNGAWKVYRFSKGIEEAPTWTQDGEGYTSCFFNRTPDLMTAAQRVGMVELPDNKGFQGEAGRAVEVAELLGKPIKLPEGYLHRTVTVRSSKDKNLIITMDKEKSDHFPPDPDWAKGKTYWQLLVKVPTTYDDEHQTSDQLVRALETPQEDERGYAVQTESGWRIRNLSTARNVLKSYGHPKEEADRILGAASLDPWKVICDPFGDELPGNRQWNLRRPQYKVTPKQGDHPHWDKVYGHCFESLDKLVLQDSWCREAQITDGAGYGRAWVASAIRFPYGKLPYLFFTSEQNCGKSTLHESLHCLITDGVIDVTRALTSQFNKTLEGAVFGYIEEMDLRGVKGVFNKIKHIVTATMYTIRAMYCNEYQVPACCHFMQFGNDESHLPVEPGDTKTMVLPVAPLAKPNTKVEGLLTEVPRDPLNRELEREAPAFLWTLLHDTQLPEATGRFRVPPIETACKHALMNSNEHVVAYIEERITKVEGRLAKKSVTGDYQDWCYINQAKAHSRTVFGRKFVKLLKLQTSKGERYYDGIKLND